MILSVQRMPPKNNIISLVVHTKHLFTCKSARTVHTYTQANIKHKCFHIYPTNSISSFGPLYPTVNTHTHARTLTKYVPYSGSSETILDIVTF